jgi:hypothetical protein
MRGDELLRSAGAISWKMVENRLVSALMVQVCVRQKKELKCFALFSFFGSE